MLSKIMMRTSNRCFNTNVSAISFRPGTLNPYKHNPTPLSEAEKHT